MVTACRRERAHEHLAQLAIVNRGLAGGDGYRALQKELSTEARPPA